MRKTEKAYSYICVYNLAIIHGFSGLTVVQFRVQFMGLSQMIGRYIYFSNEYLLWESIQSIFFLCILANWVPSPFEAMILGIN